jgi:N-acyl homoserine lactone hydrolase
MKLFLLRLGSLQPPDMPLAIPVPGYVVQTDDGTNILIDTGFPRSFIDNPPPPFPPRNLQIEVRPEDYVINRLATIGLYPRDIQFLICTHFDPDHAGNHELFTNSELIVQRRHYEAAKAGHARSGRSREHWDAPGLRYRLIDGDTTLLPGVELIESSGHVLGHQSVLVRLPKTGPVLLAIDAISAASMLDADTRAISPMDEDEQATRASTRKLTDLAKKEGVKLIVHGHDPQQWAKLRHAPEFYE